MAEASAKILAGGGHENMTYAIAGNISYSFQYIAGMLTELAGKTISFTSPTKEEYS